VIGKIRERERQGNKRGRNEHFPRVHATFRLFIYMLYVYRGGFKTLRTMRPHRAVNFGGRKILGGSKIVLNIYFVFM